MKTRMFLGLLLAALTLSPMAYAVDTCQYTAAPPNNAAGGNNAPVSMSCSGTGLRVDTSGSSAPLPTGAATSANQTNVQSAPGASAGTAIGVQGVAGGVPVPISGTVSSTPPTDLTPATQNVTAQDTVTTSTAQANGQTVFSGTPTAGSAATFALSSNQDGIISVTGTWTGTLQVEIFDGNNWIVHGVHQISLPLLSVTSFTQNFTGSLNLAAKTTLRVRSTAAWTGTATVKVTLSNNVATVYVGGPVQLVDGSSSTSTTKATIKAASTAPLATDPALVVGISPNSPTLPISAASLPLPTGAATAANQATMQTTLGTIATNTSSPIVAGTNLIGKVGIDQTTPGTTNAVVATGNVASGVADSGNAVKVGGVFNTNGITITTGQRGDVQLDAQGSTRVNPVSTHTTGSDGKSNSTIGYNSRANAPGTADVLPATVPYDFNGATWDRARGDVNGSVNQPFAMAASRWQYAPPTGGITNSATAVVVMTAGGAGVRNYMARLEISTSTLATGSEIVVLDGAAVIWRGFVGTVSGAQDHQFDIPLRGTANTSMSVQMVSASATGNVYVSAQGFQSGL